MLEETKTNLLQALDAIEEQIVEAVRITNQYEEIKKDIKKDRWVKLYKVVSE